MNKILEDAKALVDEIYKNMTNVETCEALSDAVAEQEVVLVKSGSDRYVKLDGVLTEEQMQDVKKYILNAIDGNKAEAERFLHRVSGKAATINPDFEEVVQEMISQEQTEIEEQEVVEVELEEAPELTIDAVKAVYTEGDMTIRQAADHFGVSQSKLYSFISEHGLRKPKKYNTPWRTGGRK